VNTGEVLDKIRNTESPLKRQLLMAGLISKLLVDKGKDAPLIIGGCALSYYSREVYFTADIDFAYADREAIDQVLRSIGFNREGRYWISEDLKLAVEVSASALTGEDAPVEIVEMGEGLQCKIIGIEDLIIDRLNACKHWKYETDCEMVYLLIRKYLKELDWAYLETKAADPDNNTAEDLKRIRDEVENETEDK
jgi:hypothetical protein